MYFSRLKNDVLGIPGCYNIWDVLRPFEHPPSALEVGRGGVGKNFTFSSGREDMVIIPWQYYTQGSCFLEVSITEHHRTLLCLS